MSRLPDFIIIGAMKCATSTLHEQLARQPGILMSEPKEPNFFSDDGQYARGMGWYESLFAAAPSEEGSLCGESSTHYAKLPTYPRTIERLLAHLPRTVRFVYVMRHPVDRLVSQYIHEWTQRVIDAPIDQAIERHLELVDYGRYAMQLKPFIEAWGRERILPVFFDRLTDHPQEELERVCRFIGHPGRPVWDDSLSEQNVSSQRLRKSAWRDAVINLPGAKALRRALVPRSIRDRIKSFWMMRRRPELSPESRLRLEQVFDADLAELGRWLDLPLSCANFKSLTKDQPREWKTPKGAAVA